ncbi:MAG: Thymidylate kinase [Candidatus Curtissbacteria bacterium GW2011_GWA1_40_16]|uniref:Thymidylate kinase n=1 Tax=Candidatus Curtissbacteria bacterium GW2011_GWA1_40_16 TaxID=1618405 RepID=A0A0G0RMU8_9BACT|nr:MAG: Thymidylate kinase [Candidatus Curtissbacteria bacterium GW2011_GWA1_40_16]
MSKRNKGKFIVFEGPDGVGKTTQAKLLFQYLQKTKIPAAYISFPRYEASMWGEMVRRYLNGDFGKLDGYLASMLYAGDRFSAAGQIRKWLSEGKLVVADRYIASNIGHQAGKFEKLEDQNKFIKWLENLEYGENNIPREDLVIFLNLPLDVSLKFMSKRKKLDIHESDKKHLINAHAVYNRISKRPYWVKVDNVQSGKLLPVDAVHKKVLEALKKKKLI